MRGRSVDRSSVGPQYTYTDVVCAGSKNIRRIFTKLKATTYVGTDIRFLSQNVNVEGNGGIKYVEKAL